MIKNAALQKHGSITFIKGIIIAVQWVACKQHTTKAQRTRFICRCCYYFLQQRYRQYLGLITNLSKCEHTTSPYSCSLSQSGILTNRVLWPTCSITY